MIILIYSRPQTNRYRCICPPRNRVAVSQASVHIPQHIESVSRGRLCETSRCKPCAVYRHPSFSLVQLTFIHHKPKRQRQDHRAFTMTHRFPYDEKEHAASKQTIHDALTVMHQNDIPFQWVEEDGSSLLGCYASLRYGSLLFTDRKSLRHERAR